MTLGTVLPAGAGPGHPALPTRRAASLIEAAAVMYGAFRDDERVVTDTRGSIEGRSALAAGAGTVASRRIAALAAAGPRLRAGNQVKDVVDVVRRASVVSGRPDGGDTQIPV